jgi:hypothetical protein
MAYRISYRDGRADSECDTYDEAIDEIEREWSEAEIGHDGDLTENDGCGARTLCWADEASSVDDAGSQSVAEITREE